MLISLLLIAIYGFAVYHLLLEPGQIDGSPTLGENFIWLMGVSHASYLAYKAAPHTRAAPSDPPRTTG